MARQLTDLVLALQSINCDAEQLTDEERLLLWNLYEGEYLRRQKEKGRSTETSKTQKRRSPPASIAGKGRTFGDIVSPIVPEEDWECLR